MADGSIKIAIEVDGKQVDVASKQLDKLEDAGSRSGKGIKSAESSLDSLSNKSAKAGSSVRGTSDAVDNLGDSGSKAGKGLKGAEGALDGVANSSGQASSSIKGASDSIEGLGSSGDSASKGLQGVDGAIHGVGDSSSQASPQVKGMSDTMGDVDGKTSQASGSLRKFGASIGIIAIATAAFSSMKSSMDQAISRFDTLNAFPKVLQALGVSAEDSDAAMAKLSDGIDGLPTKLNDIAGSAQRMYTSFSDMDKATDTAIALNNALLGSGSSAEAAKRGTDQYIKALQTGQINMDTWNALSETMDVGLIKIAESFGYTGKSAKDDLYKALQDGTHTFDEFNDKLIEVGTGTGVMAELAKENSLGIATSFGNLRNAVANGVAKIIESVNEMSKAVTGKDIAQNIDSLKSIVNASFSAIQKAIESTTPFFEAFGSAISATMPIIEALSPVLIGLASAYAIHSVVNMATTAIKTNAKVVALATAAQNAYAIATNRLSLAVALHAAKLKITSIALISYNKVIALATAAQAMLTSGLSLASIATVGLSGAISILGTAIKVLLGPVGWVTLAIGALVGAVVGIVKWFNKASEEGEQLTAETEQLGESTEALSDSVNSNAEAYKSSVSEINAASEANNQLLEKVQELSDKENKSAEDKQLLSGYIDELNGSVEGLNLMYDEEAEKLNMSSEQMQARIDLMKDQETAQAAQERLTEILKEQSEVEQQLAETNQLREEWNQKLEDGSVKSGEYKKAVKDLDEQEATLKETNQQLGDQAKVTEEQMTTANANVTQAIQSGNAAQIISYDDLTEAQQAAFDKMEDSYSDLKEAATDAFDKINDKSKASADEMIENLKHNQKMVENWGENHGELMKWAGENGHDGFMQWLETLGPDSAAELAVVADMSDSKLAEFAKLMDGGGETATSALNKSLGDGFETSVGLVSSMVENSATTMRSDIANAGFEEIGRNIPDGMSGGIKNGEDNIISATSSITDALIRTAEDNLEINSPSRVFMGFGKFVIEGLRNGINDGESNVINSIMNMTTAMINKTKAGMRDLDKASKHGVTNVNNSIKRLPGMTQTAMSSMQGKLTNGAARSRSTMSKLSANMVSPFRNTRGQLSSIGSNAMSGLRAGLNGGIGSVMSTARSIAGRVASTMKKALKIHSPSRVMEDDVGKWIPAGIAVGIEDNAKMVYKALDEMSSGMVKPASPEVALGTSQMAYNGSDSMAQAVKNIKLPEINKSDGSLAGLLREQNSILTRLLNKNQDTYLDGEKITNTVNENNAILAGLSIF